MLQAVPWWVFSIVGNVSIIAIETINAKALGSWATVLPRTAPLILLAQFCLFRAWSGAGSLFLAWMVFTIGNSLVRVSSVAVWSPETVGRWDYVVVGIAVMVSGGWMLKEGLT